MPEYILDRGIETLKDPNFHEIMNDLMRLSGTNERIRKSIREIKSRITKEFLQKPGIVVLKPDTLGIGWLNYTSHTGGVFSTANSEILPNPDPGKRINAFNNNLGLVNLDTLPEICELDSNLQLPIYRQIYQMDLQSYQRIFNLNLEEIFDLEQFDDIEVEILIQLCVDAVKNISWKSELDLEFGENFFELIKSRYALMYKSIELGVKLIRTYSEQELPPYWHEENSNEMLLYCFDEYSQKRRYYRVSLSQETPNLDQMIDKIIQEYSKLVAGRNFPSITGIERIVKETKSSFRTES